MSPRVRMNLSIELASKFSLSESTIDVIVAATANGGPAVGADLLWSKLRGELGWTLDQADAALSDAIKEAQS